MRPVARAALTLVIRLRWFGLLSRVYGRALREVRPDGSMGPVGTPTDDRFTLLALSPHRFRGDLAALAARPDVRVLAIPERWQTRLFDRFYRRGGEQLAADKPVNLHHPERDPAVGGAQRTYHAFLRPFLRRIFVEAGIDCVIGADIRYVADIDWGITARRLGVPYVVLHRESLLASPSVRRRVEARHRDWAPMVCDHVIVYSEVARQSFIDAGYCPPERISALGCLRMDALVDSVAGAAKAPPARPRLVLFSFVHHQKSYDMPVSVFRDAHVAAARVAERNPGVDVVIKPKREHIEKAGWGELLQRSFADAGIDPDALPNLQILPDIDAQEAIRDASVVVSLNSTALLEASIAGKAVVVPFFQSIRGADYAERILFFDDLHLFDIPADGDEMVALLEARLADPVVDDATLDARRRLATTYLGPLDGRATERCVALMRRAAAGDEAADRAAA